MLSFDTCCGARPGKNAPEESSPLPVLEVDTYTADDYSESIIGDKNKSIPEPISETSNFDGNSLNRSEDNAASTVKDTPSGLTNTFPDPSNTPNIVSIQSDNSNDVTPGIIAEDLEKTGPQQHLTKISSLNNTATTPRSTLDKDIPTAEVQKEPNNTDDYVKPLSEANNVEDTNLIANNVGEELKKVNSVDLKKQETTGANFEVHAGPDVNNPDKLPFLRDQTESTTEKPELTSPTELKSTTDLSSKDTKAEVKQVNQVPETHNPVSRIQSILSLNSRDLNLGVREAKATETDPEELNETNNDEKALKESNALPYSKNPSLSNVDNVPTLHIDNSNTKTPRLEQQDEIKDTSQLKNKGHSSSETDTMRDRVKSDDKNESSNLHSAKEKDTELSEPSTINSQTTDQESVQESELMTSQNVVRQDTVSQSDSSESRVRRSPVIKQVRPNERTLRKSSFTKKPEKL